MKAFRYLTKSVLLFAAVLFFQSCYESEVPLTTSGEAIPKNYLGIWYETGELSEPKGKRKHYEITKGKKNTMIIKKKTYNAEEKTWDAIIYKGHLSKVNDALFLNYQEISEEDLENDNVEAPYSFFKIDKDGSLFKLSSVTGNLSETFESSKELYNYFVQNHTKSFFYDKSEALVLINKESADK